MTVPESSVAPQALPKKAKGSQKSTKSLKAQSLLAKYAPYFSNATDDSLQLRSTAARGRHVVAAKDLAPGSVLHEEAAYTHIVRRGHVADICTFCLNQFKTLINPAARLLLGQNVPVTRVSVPCKVGKCGELTNYCSEECRLADEERHSLECEVVGALERVAIATNSEWDLLRILVAVLAKKALETKHGVSDGDPGVLDSRIATWSAVCDIPNSRELKVRLEKDWIDQCSKAAKFLHELLPASMRLPPSELMDLACRIQSIVQLFPSPLRPPPEGQPPQTDLREAVYAVFPVTMLWFAHSCNANAIMANKEELPVPTIVATPSSYPRLVVRSIRQIPANTEVAISFVDTFLPRAERRIEIFCLRNMWCECQRCKPPIKLSADRFLNGIVCLNCNDGVYAIEEDAKASLERLLKSVQEEKDRLKEEAKKSASEKDVGSNESQTGNGTSENVNGRVATENGNGNVNGDGGANGHSEVAETEGAKPNGNGTADSSDANANGVTDIVPEEPPAPITLAKALEDAAEPRSSCTTCGHEIPTSWLNTFQQILQGEQQRLAQLLQQAQTPSGVTITAIVRPSVEAFLTKNVSDSFRTATPAQNTSKALAKLKLADTDSWTEAEALGRMKLHPSANMVVATRIPLLNLIISDEEWQAAYFTTKEIISAMERSGAIPTDHPEMGDFHLYLADNALRVSQMHSGKAGKLYEREAREAYRRCFEIRRRCFGDDHSKTIEVKRRLGMKV
ncbi:hypothetical protein M427DRAFT_59854 [Gonapodya prolifera JEL478]|uniref:SET domain-containing protein n=1 Tax=Gonapodya prolifera (strain JEL478) TaxID=1344416 RepID=A0A139A5F6_GONPJ|nr:hypothetical protein M427DRAFT_59854 [Gonapodya prolifera JEL478]|eukprot:KXS11984.1 hypothetical protein M427DRAFT_59854 [Gonapodya prolifera JEL478]